MDDGLEEFRDTEGWMAIDATIQFLTEVTARSQYKEIAIHLIAMLEDEKSYMQGVIDSLRWSNESLSEIIEGK